MNFKLVNTRFVIPLGELSDKLRAKKDFVNKKRVSLNRLGFFERSLYPYCGEKHNCYRYFPFVHVSFCVKMISFTPALS